jgi:hypothetical protein
VSFVFGAVVLLGVAAGLASCSPGCNVASKYVSFLVGFSFCLVVFLLVFSVELVEAMDMSSLVLSLAALPGSGLSLAALPGSGVMAAEVAFVWLLGVGGTTVLAVVDGAKDNFVCCGPGEAVSLSLSTLVCFVLRPPLGEASFPVVLVGFRFAFARRAMVAHVASVRIKT